MGEWVYAQDNIKMKNKNLKITLKDNNGRQKDENKSALFSQYQTHE